MQQRGYLTSLDLVSRAGDHRSLVLPALRWLDFTGEDADGDYLLQRLREEGVDCRGVTRTRAAATAMTQVMTAPDGQRTFFHARGASALLDVAHFRDLSEMTARSGILAAGTLLVDHVQRITHWPDQGWLTEIVARERCSGGAVPNVLLTLARMQSGLPLAAAGAAPLRSAFIKSTSTPACPRRRWTQ
ncbi:hypothetical protein CRX72_21095 [Pantoea sp. BRM17]|nr:hypothetical protein CRX72_21095 [Pantoea sp. BRM17]